MQNGKIYAQADVIALTTVKMRVHESGPIEASQVDIQVGNVCALRQLHMQIAMHVELQIYIYFFFFARCI